MGLLLRSHDGSRSIEVSLPPTWRVLAGDPVATRFHVFRAAESRRLTGAASLLFEGPDGSSSMAARFVAPGTLEFAWEAETPSDLFGATLRIRGGDDALGLVEALNATSTGGPLRWTADVDGDYRLTPSGSAPASTAVLVQKLVFGTYFGGSGSERVHAMAVAWNGSLVVAGSTGSIDFPSLAGGYDTTGDSASDAFVAGLSPDGTTLEFATFYGGSGTDSLAALAIASDGTLYISGITYSVDLPTTLGAFDTTANGNEDSYVAHMSSDGSSLLQSTYIGGSGIGSDGITNLHIDPNDGSIVVMGRTCSSDWPTTPGSFSPQLQGNCDIVVTRFSPDLSTLLASTYFGGASGDYAGVFGILADGSIVLSGLVTTPTGLPITLSRGAFPNAEPDDQAYLARLSGDLSTLVWSTWVKASIGGIHPKPDGSIVMVGGTNNPDFPTTAGAYSQEYTGQAGVSKELIACAITPDAQTLLWSTFITADGTVGGIQDSALDSEGRVYFCGSLSTPFYPFTPDAFDTTLTGLSEGQITVLDATGSNVLYASLLGVGDGLQSPARSLVVDSCAGVFVAGETHSAAFPVTPGAFDETYNGGQDAWIVRITTFNPWVDLGGGVVGVNGRPKLQPSGQLCEGEPTSIDIIDGPDNGLALLVLGASELSVPLKGGTLVPALDITVFLPLNAAGAISVPFTWVPGVPSGVDLWWQAWMPDPAGPFGFSATNGVRSTTP